MRPQRIAILGTASSGKTTLAAALAKRYGTLWVPEYLREFVDAAGRVPVDADQFHIARVQRERENMAALAAQRYLFCDTTPLMTAVYSRHYFGGIDAQLAPLADAHLQDYDLTLVTAADIPWQADGLMRENEEVSIIINRMLNQELTARGIPYVPVSGSIEQRVAQVADALSRL
ncbi:nicotinamide-nucleotide adenylyltransferase, NadR type [Duganella sacchari]|uniref:Nicotinamide-nucleotide adenylyltransferase, NadR type n=1 Tax=Duganella sacchari TaxID=551987 RepID=A0A1M7HBV7_9BURK|nr:ATP-binding protein [Duganella sacchari]SHM25813.1 nicotinamide-nucleotide adenylyltransferase, NadR type [Duganella sacchari]